MKKILLTIAMAWLAVSSYGEDSYLLWMVNPSVGAAGAFDYDMVRVRAFDDSGSHYLNLYYQGEDGLAEMDGSGMDNNYFASRVESVGSAPFYAALSGYADGYSYVIELFHDNAFVAQSEALPYSQAAAQEYIASTTGLQGALTAWTPSSYAVPEPNSALLLLLGCAGLALRRRRLMHA